MESLESSQVGDARKVFAAMVLQRCEIVVSGIKESVGVGYQPRQTSCRSLSRHRERTLTVTDAARAASS